MIALARSLLKILRLWAQKDVVKCILRHAVFHGCKLDVLARLALRSRFEIE